MWARLGGVHNLTSSEKTSRPMIFLLLAALVGIFALAGVALASANADWNADG
jgi:hypothetical protein